MAEYAIEILLVEDNPNDVRLTLHAFKRHNLANRIYQFLMIPARN